MALFKNESDLFDYIECLKLNDFDFDIIQSSSKITVICNEFKRTYFPNDLKEKKGLHFIKKLKDYINANFSGYYFDKPIQYIKQNKKMSFNKWYSHEVYEIDLKAAYWYFAKKNGFINDEIFNEGLTVDKKIRLMALGSLAKTITTFKYKGFDLIETPLYDNSDATRGIFLKVAFDTGQVMNELMKNLNSEDVFFYWVDAIFFKGKKNKEKIEQAILKIGLDYKIVPIKKIMRKENKIIVIDKEGARPFNFVKKVKKYV